MLSFLDLTDECIAEVFMKHNWYGILQNPRGAMVCTALRDLFCREREEGRMKLPDVLVDMWNRDLQAAFNGAPAGAVIAVQSWGYCAFHVRATDPHRWVIGLEGPEKTTAYECKFEGPVTFVGFKISPMLHVDDDVAAVIIDGEAARATIVDCVIGISVHGVIVRDGAQCTLRDVEIRNNEDCGLILAGGTTRGQTTPESPCCVFEGVTIRNNGSNVVAHDGHNRSRFVRCRCGGSALANFRFTPYLVDTFQIEQIEFDHHSGGPQTLGTDWRDSLGEGTLENFFDSPLAREYLKDHISSDVGMDIDFDQRWSLVLTHKDEASTIRREYSDFNSIEAAAAMYRDALRLCHGFTTLTLRQQDKVSKMKAILHSNLTSCLIRRRRWTPALEHCNALVDLEPTNPRALCRRAQIDVGGNVGENCWEDAIADFTEAAGLARKDKSIARQLRACAGRDRRQVLEAFAAKYGQCRSY